MSVLPEPVFQKKLSKISWKKIYSRSYGVSYSEMAILCISPKAKFLIPTPSVDHIIIPDGENTAFYVDKKTWNNLVNSLDKKYAQHIDRLENYEKAVIDNGKKYVNFAKEIAKKKFSNMPISKLEKIYEQYQKKLFRYSTYVWTAFILNNFVADRAESIIDQYLTTKSLRQKKPEILQSLFNPEKLASVLKLQKEVHQSKKNLTSNLHRLFEKYRWLSCQDLHNKPWTLKQFGDFIKSLPNEEKIKIPPFSEFISMLKINRKHKRYLNMVKKMIYIKDARDELRRRGIYYILPFFAEVAKRMKIRPKEISLLLSSEITSFFQSSVFPSKKIIESRKHGFVMYINKTKNIVCLHDNESRQALKKFGLNEINKIKEKITGRIASQGTARGKVAIVRGIKDLAKIKKGTVLVAVTTHPDYTMAMLKAAAIITDEGGITSHAAIVSREYQIPCIVGTKVATRVLQDGDEVFVDATSGVVNKINH